MESFEELECWKLGTFIRRNISEKCKSFPATEKFNLTSQIIRCSRSVTNNIAEGYGRYHYQENIQFCRQSRGSLFELIDHLIIALDEGYIDESWYKSTKADILKCIKILNGYIKYLVNSKGT